MMHYINFFKILFFLPFIILNGCDIFKSNKFSSSEIKTASSWTSNDERPSFNECEDINNDEGFDCFESIVSETILKYLSNEILEINEEVDEEIKVVIKVDKEGFFSLLSIDASDFIKDKIEGLEEFVENAVYSIPQALPAVKVNVEEYVNTKFELPIRILSQESL